MQIPKLTEERIKKYLLENKRFDSRKADEFREITIETDVSKNAEGSARVKIGKTEVIVGVKMDVGEPYPDSPDKGNLMVTAELLPLSSPEFESGPPRFPSIELGRVIDRGIRESKLIELEKLCIKEKEKVWTIFIDIYSINDDGNLIDAAGIGALAALKTARMPKYDEKEEKVLYGELSDKKIPLAKELPISITAYKLGDKFIVDPTKEEEKISEARLTAASSDGTIFAMQKGQMKEMKTEEFFDALELINKTEREVFKKLEKFVK
jgi:exosome complex component RRP42